MSKVFLVIKIGLITALALASFAYSQSRTPLKLASNAHFSFLDIGQGDALLIRSRENRFILIDTGPGENILHALDRNWQQDYVLDVLVISHPDEDHAAGAIALVERNLVRNIWVGANMQQSDHNLWQLIQKSASKHNVPITYFTLGDQFLFGCCLLFNAVWPPPDPSNKGTNETSLSFLISEDNFDLLSLGDLGHTQELAVANYLRANFAKLDLELLKVSHHGSKTSTSQEFLQKVSPEIAVIPVGRNNRYKHPAVEVLANLESENIGIYRTDILGDIFVEIINSVTGEIKITNNKRFGVE